MLFQIRHNYKPQNEYPYSITYLYIFTLTYWRLKVLEVFQIYIVTFNQRKQELTKALIINLYHNHIC